MISPATGWAPDARRLLVTLLGSQSMHYRFAASDRGRAPRAKHLPVKGLDAAAVRTGRAWLRNRRDSMASI